MSETKKRGRIKDEIRTDRLRRIAARHLEAAQENHMEVVAVCDIVPEQIERFLEKHELQDAPIRKYTD